MPTRALSHTTLERKIRLIFGLMILLIIVASLFFPWYQMETLVTDQDLLSARQMASQAWFTLHPRPLPGEVSAEAVQEFLKMGPPPAIPDADPPRIIRLDAPQDRKDLAPRDPLEREWLERFQLNKQAPPRSRSIASDKGYHFKYAYPLRARESCISTACHGEAQAGDLLGAIVISFPTEKARTTIIANRAILIAAAIIVAVLSMILF